MIAMMRERLNKEEGFTLVELMVVVLIIAILIAIAIPTFLGARERAQDRAAQSNLRNALTAEKVYYTDEEQYTSEVASLTAIEPSLAFDTMAAAGPNIVGVAVEDNTVVASVVTLATQSASGNWFCIADSAVTGASYDAGTTYGVDEAGTATSANVDTRAECAATGW